MEEEEEKEGEDSSPHRPSCAPRRRCCWWWWVREDIANIIILLGPLGAFPSHSREWRYWYGDEAVPRPFHTPHGRQEDPHCWLLDFSLAFFVIQLGESYHFSGIVFDSSDSIVVKLSRISPDFQITKFLYMGFVRDYLNSSPNNRLPWASFDLVFPKMLLSHEIRFGVN